MKITQELFVIQASNTSCDS